MSRRTASIVAAMVAGVLLLSGAALARRGSDDRPASVWHGSVSLAGRERPVELFQDHGFRLCVGGAARAASDRCLTISDSPDDLAARLDEDADSGVLIVLAGRARRLNLSDGVGVPLDRWPIDAVLVPTDDTVTCVVFPITDPLTGDSTSTVYLTETAGGDRSLDAADASETGDDCLRVG